MSGLEPEDLMILGVALIIVLNRAFVSTPLKLRRPAYVVIQLFNLATMGVLLSVRLEGYPPKLEGSVRVFLMFFVAWHMVLANQGRAQALRRRVEQAREQERRAEEKAERLARWEAEAAEAEPPPH